ncbi:MAG TPA: transglycosylase domain-containing protein [Chitinophagaceae bacterium]|nr:transglycosylase domain-containing protein [Chitinophagaceae bacterium]MCC6636033.1 transglycosylase domain-containing protein [Chitinophagaceae bacterium]HMZ46284.1 transglycosylase domain-containing protein [Chitinophagaceae bacterium]
MKKSVKIVWQITFGGIVAFVLFILLCSWGAFGKMPDLEDIQNPSASLSSQVYAQDGSIMGKYYLQDRINIQFKNIAQPVLDAVIATEDERFYTHSGIDLRALGRAFAGLGRDGGASTITMQTAKNLFTDNWATKNFIVRSIQKFKEAIIAVKLEKNFTKEEIITLYLNTVAFSDNVYGIRNAAKTFFQKEPDSLNVKESAVLIGMLKGATLYNPRRNYKTSFERRNVVMNQMVKNNKLSKASFDTLKLQPIDLNYRKLDENAGIGPYFRMILGEELKKWCKEHKKNNGKNYDLYRDGLKIYTTINPKMQVYAEQAVDKHISEMQKYLSSQSNIKSGAVWKGRENVLDAAMKQSDRWRNMKSEGADEETIKKSFYEKTKMKVFSWNKNREADTVMTPFDSIKYSRQMLQAGFMVMDPITGEVKAWVGGIDFKNYKYDHVNFNTKRQVGSTIKPLLYGLAIEEAGLTPTSMVQDVQQSFGSYGLVPATSKTCTGATMPMAQALAGSRNCASAYIIKQLDNSGNNGARRFVDFLKRCDFKTKLDAYPSMALGACEISLYEMLQGYTMFPGRGFNVQPMFITRIEDRNGNVLETFTPKRKEVISDVTAYSVIKMMEGVMEFGTGRRIWSYDVKGKIAGKTGTTNDNSDAWFIGYTPQILAGTWVGCDDRFIRFNSTAIGQGASAALPIWAYFYEKASRDPACGLDVTSTFAKPEALTNDIIIDGISGFTPVPGGETEDGGAGTSSEYGEESSEYNDDSTTPTQTNETQNSDNKNNQDNKNKTEKKQPPATLPNKDQKPKAVIPKKNT